MASDEPRLTVSATYRYRGPKRLGLTSGTHHFGDKNSKPTVEDIAFGLAITAIEYGVDFGVFTAREALDVLKRVIEKLQVVYDNTLTERQEKDA